jgi:hypothetical protein
LGWASSGKEDFSDQGASCISKDAVTAAGALLKAAAAAASQGLFRLEAAVQRLRQLRSGSSRTECPIG